MRMKEQSTAQHNWFYFEYHRTFSLLQIKGFIVKNRDKKYLLYLQITQKQTQLLWKESETHLQF